MEKDKFAVKIKSKYSSLLYELYSTISFHSKKKNKNNKKTKKKQKHFNKN